MLIVSYGSRCCGVGVMGGRRSDGFSLQFDTSYMPPSVQNSLVASSNSGVVLTQRNPGINYYDSVLTAETWFPGLEVCYV